MSLPAQYAWLANESGPKMLQVALANYGLLEAPGAADNPKILAFADRVGVRKTYVHDSIPWCGLFIAYCALESGKDIPKTPLWALSWATDFGKKAEGGPQLGDVLVFKRDGGGHVTLYVGEDHDAYHCLGGNQSDSVNITRIAKARLYAARRPLYNVQPENVRKVVLSASGKLSANEA